MKGPRRQPQGLCMAFSRLIVLLLLAGATAESFFDFTTKDANGAVVPLSKYKDKPVILVVNVASRCGYTESNYDQLQQLYEKYQKSGLEILAWPCNQFGHQTCLVGITCEIEHEFGQEPGSNKDIQAFAQGRGATFPVFSKVKVNGPSQADVFEFLKRATPGSNNEPLPWNFNKFLVVKGQPRARYAHNVEPFAIEPDIVKALEDASAEL